MAVAKEAENLGGDFDLSSPLDRQQMLDDEYEAEDAEDVEEPEEEDEESEEPEDEEEESEGPEDEEEEAEELEEDDEEKAEDEEEEEEPSEDEIEFEVPVSGKTKKYTLAELKQRASMVDGAQDKFISAKKFKEEAEAAKEEAQRKSDDAARVLEEIMKSPLDAAFRLLSNQLKDPNAALERVIRDAQGLLLLRDNYESLPADQRYEVDQNRIKKFSEGLLQQVQAEKDRIAEQEKLESQKKIRDRLITDIASNLNEAGLLAKEETEFRRQLGIFQVLLQEQESRGEEIDIAAATETYAGMLGAKNGKPQDAQKAAKAKRRKALEKLANRTRKPTRAKKTRKVSSRGKQAKALTWTELQEKYNDPSDRFS